MYQYEATLLNVVDGDTVDLEVSLGFNVFKRERLRLYGIDTAEMNSSDPAKREKAKAAKQYLIDNLPTERRALLIITIKDTRDKYGRYLATIYAANIDPHINGALVTAGLAVPYFGTGPKG